MLPLDALFLPRVVCVQRHAHLSSMRQSSRELGCLLLPHTDLLGRRVSRGVWYNEAVLMPMGAIAASRPR